MKTYSKKQLKEKAAKVFDQFPTAKELFATVDGNIFLEKNRAQLHSKDTIYTFDRPVESSSEHSSNQSDNSTDQKIDYRLAIATIKDAKSKTEIAPFKEDERKTVKAAYDAKVEEFDAEEKAAQLKEDLSSIETAETIADIESFEADERPEIKAAYDAKVKEFVAEEKAAQLKEDLSSIETAETIADIESFEADERPEIKAAYDAKREELTNNIEVND